MKASQYNLFVEGEHAIYAVNLLSRTAIELSPDAYQTYLALIQNKPLACEESDVRRFQIELEKGLFLVEDNFDEVAYLRYLSHRDRFDQREFGLVITPTMGCNFGCHYCFEDKSDVVLSSETCDKILQLVSINLAGKENFSVQWFGGEPLQALNIMEDLSRKFLRLAASAEVQYAATVITNGYLMNEPVSKLLGELGVQAAQITLDGDRALHDRTRSEPTREGSFDVILENIRQASRYFAIKVRVHVAPFSFPSVRQLIDTLAEKGMAEHISELYFAPLFNYRAGMNNFAYLPDGKRFMTSEAFSKMQVELLRQAIDRGFSVPDFLDASYGICTAVRDNTLVIDASGDLFKCYKDVGVNTQAIGSLETGPKPAPNLLKWMDVQIPRDDECRECAFLPICLGGCSKQWQENAPKSVICTPLRYNANELIRLYFENGRFRELQGECSEVSEVVEKN